MGIYICCGESSYSSGYSNWHKLRNSLAKAAVNYMEHEKQRLLDLETDDNKCPQNQQIISEIENILKTQETPSDYFKFILTFCRDNEDTNNTLIFLGIYGIYVLCNKNDGDSYYSVGNSYDILEMINKVKPFFEGTSENLKYIMDVFETSINKKEIVTIM